MFKPLIAITQGDPTGIGPETIVRAWRSEAVHQWCRLAVVGHPHIFRRAVELLGVNAEVVRLESMDAIRSIASTLNVIPCIACGTDDALNAVAATIDPRGGQAAFDALIAAANLAINGKVDAIVTAPLHKAALWQAGHHYPGHTELLAELCGVNDFAMMLYLSRTAIDEHYMGQQDRGLGVVHVTLHMALTNVFSHLSIDAIVAKAKLIDRTMEAIDGPRPRIGVCALNPHAGEEGLFGDEEERIIAPAVALAKEAGLTIEGPLPADTLMVRARDGDFDAVVAMYHDQGHIAIKLLGMHHAVNVTLGLPIVRTSVAHGTAFDLAWQGRAESSSMVEALRIAARLAHSKRQL